VTFKLGITRDLLDAQGEPCFGHGAFDELNSNPNIDWEWIPEQLDTITPDVAARYDGIHVNIPRVTAASVERDDCRVKIIARNGVGFDTVDTDAMSNKGIIVTNTPAAVRRPVAVATLTMIFALSGRLLAKNNLVRQGRWNDRTSFMGQGLTGRTLGVIGVGGIGREILTVARPFFGSMLASDPYVDATTVEGFGATLTDLDSLMTRADFVVVCCLLNDDTHHLINAHRLAMMKPSAYFLNMGRGPITDEAALIDALRDGRIAGAGLDVTEQEPIEQDNPLLQMDNVIITPHALCWTDECFHDIAATALRSIVAVSLGQTPDHVVNPDVLGRL
jgi:phosphoglycerate dehydrogenase-like enzyme